MMEFMWQENRRETLWKEGGNHQEKGRRYGEGSQRRKENKNVRIYCENTIVTLSFFAAFKKLIKIKT